MVQYIYFVKCPNCEDEHFDFFDEAKEFALGCLSQKPVITQTEVCRNDFGECTDHSDLGTVWSWEDAMDRETEAEPAISVFTKDDLKHMAAGEDPEFDTLDNSVDFETEETASEEPETSEVSPVERKPIPDEMTIDQLKEEMEENEDTVECTWCEELFDKSECRKEVDLGWLCSRCEMAIKSRGETLTFREGNYWDFLDESTAIKNSTAVGNFVKLLNYDGSAEIALYDLKRRMKSSKVCNFSPAKINLIVAFDNSCKVISETELAYLINIPCYFRDPKDRSKILEYAEYAQCWAPKKSCVFIDSIKEAFDVKELHDLGNEYDGGYPAEAEQPIEEEIDPKFGYDRKAILSKEVEFYYEDMDYTYVATMDEVIDNLVEFVTDAEVEKFSGGRFKTCDEIADYDYEQYLQNKDKEDYWQKHSYSEWTALLEKNCDELLKAHEEEVKQALYDTAKEAAVEEGEASYDDGADPDGFYGWGDYYRWKNG